MTDTVSHFALVFIIVSTIVLDLVPCRLYCYIWRSYQDSITISTILLKFEFFHLGKLKLHTPFYDVYYINQFWLILLWASCSVLRKESEEIYSPIFLCPFFLCLRRSLSCGHWVSWSLGGHWNTFCSSRGRSFVFMSSVFLGS